MTARIIVHSLAEAQAAVAAAAALGRPVILASAPGAGVYAGAPWFKSLVAQAAALHPAAQVTALLDCGDAAGAVMAALRCGLTHLRFTGPAPVRARLSALAAAQGAEIEDPEERASAPVLDLLDHRDPAAACRDFLAASVSLG